LTKFSFAKTLTLLQIYSSGHHTLSGSSVREWDARMQTSLYNCQKMPIIHNNSQHFRTCAKKRMPRRVARMAAARPCSGPGADKLETIFCLAAIGPALLLLPLKLLEAAN
jgi:hypothetical protein